MRNFETDYSGAWRGFCKSRESAIIAAIRKMVNEGYSRCTITNRETGQVAVRLERINPKQVIVNSVHALKRAVGEKP